jgi:DNA-formamidopyrimidine glycosylase
MPEGPEVKIMLKSISMLALGKTLNISVINEGFLKKTKDLDKVPIKKIIHVEAKGKFGYMMLEDDTAIGLSFGMTGNIRIEPSDEYLKQRGETREKYMKHCKIKFVMTDDDGRTNIFYFHCTRNFAWIWYFTKQELSKKLSTIGPSILSDIIDKDILLTRWKGTNLSRGSKNICNVLMDQQHISGIGNYIKAEMLYRAKVHPSAIISNLSDDVLWHLYLCARTIADEAYQDGGASLYTYTGLHGDVSEYKLKLQVYNRIVDPLGNKVITFTTPDKRTTHWVESIQIIGKPMPVPVPVPVVPVPKTKIKAIIRLKTPT